MRRSMGFAVDTWPPARGARCAALLTTRYPRERPDAMSEVFIAPNSVLAATHTGGYLYLGDIENEEAIRRAMVGRKR